MPAERSCADYSGKDGNSATGPVKRRCEQIQMKKGGSAGRPSVFCVSGSYPDEALLLVLALRLRLRLGAALGLGGERPKQLFLGDRPVMGVLADVLLRRGLRLIHFRVLLHRADVFLFEVIRLERFGRDLA